MKFTVGHGITIAIILCVSGILTLVVLSVRERIDLISEDYYPKGISYEKQIEKIKNTNALDKKISVTVHDSLFIQFPRIVDTPDSIRGEIWIYYVADKYADKVYDINLNDSFYQAIDLNELPMTKYDILIDWEANMKQYFQKEQFFQ